MLEAEKTSGVGGWKQRERDSFGRFPTRQTSVSSELVMIDSVSLYATAMLGSGCQGLELRERR